MRGLNVGTQRFDSMVTTNDLESIDNVIYEAKESELTARTIVSIKDDDSEGDEVISYDMITKRGAAKIFAYGSSEDVPLVDVDVKRHSQRVFGIVNGFTINIQEKRSAKNRNRNIDTTKASAARRAIAEKENSFFYIGSPSHNAKGIVNATGIQTYAVPQNEGATSTKWKDKTPKERLADIKAARSKVNVKPGLTPDTLLLPPEQNEMLDDPINPDTNSMTIREFLEKQKWFKKIVAVPQLVGVGDGSTDSLVVLDSSREVVQLSVPMDITRHPEIRKSSFVSQFDLEERCGGAVIRYPLGICRADGI